MKFGFKKTFGFTIVEILVVLTIIAVVSSMGLFAYGKYALEARNSARLSSINSIQTGIDNYIIQNQKVFNPSNFIEIKNGTQVLTKQGIFSKESANISGIEEDVLDPLTKENYLLSVSKSGTKYSLQYNLEEKGITPKSTGDLSFIVSSEDYRGYNFIAYNPSTVAIFDLASPLSGYSGIYKSNVVENANLGLLVNPISSCKTIKTLLPDSKTGAYKVNIGGKDYNSKCNFDIENGAWTMVWKGLVTQAAENSTDFEELAVEGDFVFSKFMMKSPFGADYHTELTQGGNYILEKTIREYYYDFTQEADLAGQKIDFTIDGGGTGNLNNMFEGYGNPYRVFGMGRVYNKTAKLIYYGSTYGADNVVMPFSMNRVSVGGLFTDNFYMPHNLDNQTRDSTLGFSKRELQTIEVYLE